MSLYILHLDFETLMLENYIMRRFQLYRIINVQLCKYSAATKVNSAVEAGMQYWPQYAM